MSKTVKEVKLKPKVKSKIKPKAVTRRVVELPFDFSFVLIPRKLVIAAATEGPEDVLASVKSQMQKEGGCWAYFADVPFQWAKSVVRVDADKKSGRVIAVTEVARDPRTSSDQTGYYESTLSGAHFEFLPKVVKRA